MKGTEACNKKAINNAARKLGEDPRLVRSVVTSAFEFVQKTMKSGGYEGVEIPNFGKFQAKLRLIQTLHAHQLVPSPRTPKRV